MVQKQNLYEFGPFRVDPSERLLRRGVEVVPLPPKAVDVLLVLIESRGRVVEKDELLTRVWPDVSVEEGIMAQNVSLLRRVLGNEPGTDEYIKTVPKRGYRFAATVKVIDHVDLSRYRSLHSLLVLPLENLSGDPDQEFFADGMTDELISCLMRVEGLRVCARCSSMACKGVRKPLRQIAQEFNVDWIVEGAVLHSRSGERVRISACVFEGTTEHQLWAETYERRTRDVLALQSEVASAIAREIGG